MEKNAKSKKNYLFLSKSSKQETNRTNVFMNLLFFKKRNHFEKKTEERTKHKINANAYLKMVRKPIQYNKRTKKNDNKKEQHQLIIILCSKFGLQKPSLED